ncbi:hypothetical protein [Pedobacter quisquiliarum]|jgi:hypothetical protein|nr:hypothetical protein [Pedobacter quisquiliarum]
MKPQPEDETSFWTKKKQFAVTEILMYVLMILAIAAGIIFLS